MENGGNGAGPVATWPGSPIAVPPRRGAEWYSEAMAMFRQAPLPWMGLGAATVVLQIALQALPGFGSLLDKVLMPVVGIAKRHTFYIGKDGRILKIDTDIKPETSAQDMAKALGELGVAKS